MARKLSEIQLMLEGQDFVKQFVSDLRKDVKGLGGDDAMVYNAIKSSSNLRKEFAKLIVAGANGAKKLALKLLKLVEDGISIAAEGFTKDSFFTKNGPVKLYFWNNFTNWILAAMPETIPAFQGMLAKFQLTESIRDLQILGELGNPTPFTVGEFAAIIRDLLTKQAEGQSGTLLTNGYANIFYVKLDDGRVVTVGVRWNSDSREWSCHAHDLDGDRWGGGGCVFSRS